MIKRTLCFSNPAYLLLKNDQLVIKIPEVEKSNLPDFFKNDSVRTIPIEDIGVILLDHKQITLTQALLEKLLKNNCAVIVCDNQHLPVGLMMPLESNTVQHERYHEQIAASLPLKKHLWQQTISAKIGNQSAILHRYTHSEIGNMQKWAVSVKSGDSDNLEARAAAYYWAHLFPQIPDFTRKREGDYPNNLLNYGYAILRAIVTRALVSTGLLPTFGIHHRNRYNAYCLADDIMEPYRPYVDEKVIHLMQQYESSLELTQSIKAELLQIPIKDVMIEGRRSPLMVAVSATVASLYKCYIGEIRKIIYPKISSVEPI